MVCSRRDADQQCRVPQELSETHYSPAKNSWVNKAQVVDDVSRTAGGLPDPCSPVGTGGQTGCFMPAGRAAAADRRQRTRAEEPIPLGCPWLLATFRSCCVCRSPVLSFVTREREGGRPFSN